MDTIKIDKINQKYWNIHFLGIFLYEVSNICFDYIFIQNIIFRFITLISLAIILFTVKMIPKRNPFKKKWIQNIFKFLIVVNIITIIRGFLNLKVPFYTPIIDSFYMWQYLIPLYIYLKPCENIFKIIFKWAIIYLVFAIFFSIYNFSDFYYNASELAKGMIGFDPYIVNRPQIPAQFVLPFCLFIFYFDKYKLSIKLVFTIAILLALAAALMMGRRTSAASILIFIPIALIYYIPKHKLFFIMIVMSLIYFIPKMDISSYDEQFQILIERLDSNTREGTENDFYKDMNGIDWIIGRGMSGTYYSPSVSDIDTKNRPLIETGFLNIILHGGVLALLPLIIILIHASYLGLFKSQSLIYKSCGIFIFIRLLWLYPSSSFKLNLTFSILWICVAICESIESKNKINLVNKTFITN